MVLKNPKKIQIKLRLLNEFPWSEKNAIKHQFVLKRTAQLEWHPSHMGGRPQSSRSKEVAEASGTVACGASVLRTPRPTLWHTKKTKKRRQSNNLEFGKPKHK